MNCAPTWAKACHGSAPVSRVVAAAPFEGATAIPPAPMSASALASSADATSSAAAISPTSSADVTALPSPMRPVTFSTSFMKRLRREPPSEISPLPPSRIPAERERLKASTESMPSSMVRFATKLMTRTGRTWPRRWMRAMSCTEPVDQRRPFLRRYAAVEADIAEPECVETPNDDVVASRPLREHHRLGLGLGEQIDKQRRQLVGLDPMVGLLVEQIGAVARHAHVLEGTCQPPLILVRQESDFAPALDDLRHRVGVFLMMDHLHLGHGHEKGLVDAARHVPKHLRFAPADHDRLQRPADLLKARIAGDAPAFVLDLMLVKQLPGRPQAVLIDELNDGDQFFQPVLQGSPGEHNCVGAIDAFQGARRDGIPVLHALRFIDDHDLGRPSGDQLEIRHELLVICDLAEIVLRVILLPLRPAAIDDTRRVVALTSRETHDLALPLVFERGRTDHQHFRYAEMPCQYLGRRNGLDGLAKSHIVAYQRPANPNREQRALGLVGIERHVQKSREFGIGRTSREQLFELRGPLFRIPPTRDEIERIVIGTELVAAL